MPTPSEETLRPIALVDRDTTAFISCPPDETREHHAPREERIAARRASNPPREDATSAEDPSGTHGSEGLLGGGADRVASSTGYTCDTSLHREHVEDAGLAVEPSSPRVGSPDASSDSDTRLAQSMSTTAISSETPQPQYLHFSDLHRDRVGLSVC